MIPFRTVGYNKKSIERTYNDGEEDTGDECIMHIINTVPLKNQNKNSPYPKPKEGYEAYFFEGLHVVLGRGFEPPYP